MDTIGALWERNARACPDRQALVCEGRRFTHREVFERARRLASSLHALGVRRQDRVSMLAMNCAEWFDYYGACDMSGFIAGTVNFRLAPPEIAWILKDSTPRVLIFEEQYIPTLEAIRAELKGIEHYVCIGKAPAWAKDYESLLASGSIDGAPTKPLPSDCAHLIYTSGTTGRPKGAMRSQYGEIRVAQELAGGLNISGSDRMLLMMPMFHIGALSESIATLFAGGTVVLQRKFDPADALRAIEEERITHTHMAPTMVQAVLDTPGVQSRDLSSLRVFCYAAAPMPVPVLRRAIGLLGPIFINQYGSTEMGAATQLSIWEHELDGEGAKRLASVGRAFPGCDLAVLDDDGNALPAGATGEICVRGDTVMSGYWNNHASTIDAMRDGWYRTGDMAYLDDCGFVFLVDRKKDMIISGGENIYCKEVEDALMEHPAIADAAIIGVPDPKWGEAVKAIVATKAGAKLPGADDLVAHTRNLLAGYKLPRKVEFVAELPRLPSGKVNKVELRRLYGERNG